MDFENNTKLKFSSKDLQEVRIKSESPEDYNNSNEETCFTQAQCKMINITKHEVSENETRPIQFEECYRCYQCQQEFRTSAERLKHYINIHYVSQDLGHELQIRMSNESQDKPPRAKKTSFACDVCFRSYSSLSYLKFHKKIHLNKSDYKCDTCKKIFKSKNSLKIHLQVHTTEKPYECDICKKKLKYQQSLKLHIQAHMEGGRPHKCSICSMAFSKVQHLEFHMLVHTGIKKFKCDICKQAFTRKDILNSHLLIHQNKSFFCDVCNKTFVKMSYLKEHMKIHSDKKPYACNTCGKRFIYAFYLKIHMRTHSGEKPYDCDVCQRKFSRSYTLRKHKMRAHTKGRKLKKFSERKTRKSSDCKRDLRQITCDNDSDNTSKHTKERLISNSEGRESATASENSILFSADNDRYDSFHLTSEIEFADVKIEGVENDIEMYS